MDNNSKPQQTLNRPRVFFAFIYFLISLILLFISYKNDVFYLNIPTSSYNFIRFVWCISFVSMGFSGIAFQLRYHYRSPLPEYLTRYPFLLLVIASMVFSGLHIFKATSGYLFYYLSASLGFTFGYMIDRYWEFVLTLIGKLKIDKPKG